MSIELPEVHSSTYIRLTTTADGARLGRVAQLPESAFRMTAFEPTHMLVGGHILERYGEDWVEVGQGEVAMVLGEGGGRMVVTDARG